MVTDKKSDGKLLSAGRQQHKLNEHLTCHIKCHATSVLHVSSPTLSLNMAMGVISFQNISVVTIFFRACQLKKQQESIFYMRVKLIMSYIYCYVGTSMELWMTPPELCILQFRMKNFCTFCKHYFLWASK